MVAAKANVLKITAPAKQPVPQNAEEASQALAALGYEMGARMGKEAALKQAIADLTAEYMPDIQAHKAKEDALFDGLQAWAEAHRADLCKDGSKTVQLGTGEIGWRLGTEAVVYKGLKKLSAKLSELLVGTLQAKKLGAWVRVKEELDKEAILAAVKDPKMAKYFKDRENIAGIAGLAVVQEEKFRAQPLGVDTEKIAS